MKKMYLISLAALAFTAFSIDKYATVKLTAGEWNKHYQKLSTIQQIVDESNLPHDRTKFILLSIDSLKNEIATQVAPQLADTTKPKK